MNGRYIPMKKSDLMMQLRGIGLREKIYFDGQREIDWPLYEAQNKRMVDYAGALAGHRVGLFQDGSKRQYLVTDEAAGVFEKIPPCSKTNEPKFFRQFVEEILPNDQWVFFCHWLAIGLRSLIAGDFRPGQVCLFAGEHGSGKSLLQNMVTEIYGGRVGNPFLYMTGETNFNRDFVGAEHWMIEDPRGNIDMRSRREFGARLKEACVNRDYTVHAKGKDGIYLPLLRRVTISVNLELEYLSVCPPIDPSIADKINLFLCSGSRDNPLPIFTNFRDPKTGELSRPKIWEKVMAEIPHVRSWLLASFRAADITRTLRDDRFGIKAFHHPVLEAELSSLSHESRLLELIDECYWSDEPPHTKVTKKAAEIQKDLLEKNRFEAEKILRYPGACGSHLGKLVRSQPKRVAKNPLSHGYQTWTIFPPSPMEDKNQIPLGVTTFAMDAGTVAPV